VQPHPNFCGRNRSVHVMSKRSVKESRLSYGESVPNDTVTGTIHVSAGTDTTANSLQATYDSDPVLLNLRVMDAGHDSDEPATYQKMHNDQL
jgi:hypothetical protein